MSANKSNLFTQQIEDALARGNANVCANLLNIAQIFAKLDERFAAMEGKLERLLAEPSGGRIGGAAASSREELMALLDQRIKIALDRDMRERCAATTDIMRDAMKDFVDEFKQVRGEVEAKLIQLRTLLAQRTPLDPRPN